MKKLRVEDVFGEGEKAQKTFLLSFPEVLYEYEYRRKGHMWEEAVSQVFRLEEVIWAVRQTVSEEKFE